jgi:glycine cleavage system transcriptional repressor
MRKASEMAQDVVISVLARDRVGIVASVSRAVFDLGGNIDAMSQTVMRNYFTLILTVRLKGAMTLEEIRGRIAAVGRKGELAVSIQERVQAGPGEAPDAAAGEEFVLTMEGEDEPGIISRISGYLASKGINIQDLYVTTEGARFTLIGQLLVPRALDVRQMQIDLASIWPKAGFSVALQHVNIFVATNEIEFRAPAARH